LVVARDGEQAIRVLRDRRPVPDFVLLDLNLPKINGLQVLQQIRADERLACVPVVILSASGREEDIERSYALGANTYVQKPVVFDRFVEAVELLNRYWFDLARLPRAL
jgi:DNA-binding response OmpR family regulator